MARLTFLGTADNYLFETTAQGYHKNADEAKTLTFSDGTNPVTVLVDGVEVSSVDVPAGELPPFVQGPDGLDILHVNAGGGAVPVGPVGAGVTSYNDLTDKPVIPTTAAEVNALPDTTQIPSDASFAGWVNDTASQTHAALSGTYAAVGAEFRAPVMPPLPRKTMVSTLQSGHGWTAFGSGLASSNLNDTTDYAVGTQSAKITTTTDSATASIDKTGLTVDLTGKALALLLKIDSTDNLNTGQLYVGDGTLANNWNGQILNGPAYRDAQSHIRSGEWTWVTITLADLTTTQGTPDRANVARIRLNVTGRSGKAATVHLGAVATVPEPSAFPNGVVSLTFDDNFAAHYTLARPKLDQYGYQGTYYPVVEGLGTAGSLSLAQLKALRDLNGWEIGAHASVNAMHDAGGTTALTDDEFAAECETMRAWMRANNFPSDSYAWPSGDSSTVQEEIASRYFTSARGVYYRTHETFPPPNRMRLRAVNVSTLSLAQMQAEVDRAKAGKQWVVLIFHDLVAAKSKQNDTLTSDFNALIDYIAAQGVAVRTVGDVMRTQV